MFCFIDTAATGCHVAFGDEGGLIASRVLPIERGHAEALMPLYEECLKAGGKAAKDIGEVVVTVGPGSFTGLRVGLTVARFIGFSLIVPVKGITTFQAFSAGLPGDVRDRLVLIESKRSDYYLQLLDSAHKPKTEAVCLNAPDIAVPENAILTGDATQRFCSETSPPLLNERVFVQDSIDVEKVVAAIAAKQFDYTRAEALYIRDADVTRPKKKKAGQ